MNLPNNSIGISDILDYRECPERFALSMQRHTGDDAPERTNWTNAYGSAVHEAIHEVETGATHEQAIHAALQRFGTYLDPDDISLLREDLQTYERRRPLGVTLVGSEMELRVPLFVDPEHGQIYFRFRLDVLQRMISNPSVFLHRDYKSSKWQKSAAEVHGDLQMWAYNWAIHEYFPECQTLLQTYDQLRYGEERTTKSDQQRRDMKQWLIDNVRVILADETLKPKLNDFCRFCPLVVTCREPRRATAYTRGRLAVLAPMTLEGRKVKVEFAEEGDELERIVAEELPRFIQTRKHIEHVEKLLKDLVQHMPQAERERLGWGLQERRTKKIAPEGLRELHEALGDSFYQLVNLPMARLEELVGKPKRGEPLPDELQIARNYTLEEIGDPYVVPRK